MKLLAVPLFIVGLAAGFAIGRGTAGSPRATGGSSPSTPAAASAPSPAPGDAPDAGELSRLKEASQRQEDRIRELERQLQEKAAVENGVAKPDPMAPAHELWAIVKNMKRGGGRGEAQLKAMKLIGELKPEHAAFFIAKFREVEEAEARQMALMCAALAGGPEASDFIAGFLEDASTDESTRSQLLMSLAGGHGMPNHLVITESLDRLGTRMMSSPKEDERAAAAAILGLKPRDALIEQRLRGLTEADASDTVRGAAALALARGGSPETLAWLQGLLARTPETPETPERQMLRWQLERAIAELEPE